MRRLHIIRAAGDALATEVVEHQVGGGDDVRVVFTGDAAADRGPMPGVEVVVMPELEYDQLVELIAWAERVVSW
ncbi:MAG: hypothetical protein ABR573_03460 [Candidatus Dormibacteria bacterium]